MIEATMTPDQLSPCNSVTAESSKGIDSAATESPTGIEAELRSSLSNLFDDNEKLVSLFHASFEDLSKNWTMFDNDRWAEAVERLNESYQMREDTDAIRGDVYLDSFSELISDDRLFVKAEKPSKLKAEKAQRRSTIVLTATKVQTEPLAAKKLRRKSSGDGICVKEMPLTQNESTSLSSSKPISSTKKTKKNCKLGVENPLKCSSFDASDTNITQSKTKARKISASVSAPTSPSRPLRKKLDSLKSVSEHGPSSRGRKSLLRDRANVQSSTAVSPKIEVKKPSLKNMSQKEASDEPLHTGGRCRSQSLDALSVQSSPMVYRQASLERKAPNQLGNKLAFLDSVSEHLPLSRARRSSGFDCMSVHSTPAVERTRGADKSGTSSTKGFVKASTTRTSSIGMGDVIGWLSSRFAAKPTEAQRLNRSTGAKSAAQLRETQSRTLAMAPVVRRSPEPSNILSQRRASLDNNKNASRDLSMDHSQCSTGRYTRRGTMDNSQSSQTRSSRPTSLSNSLTKPASTTRRTSLDNSQSSRARSKRCGSLDTGIQPSRPKSTLRNRCQSAGDVESLCMSVTASTNNGTKDQESNQAPKQPVRQLSPTRRKSNKAVPSRPPLTRSNSNGTTRSAGRELSRTSVKKKTRRKVHKGEASVDKKGDKKANKKTEEKAEKRTSIDDFIGSDDVGAFNTRSKRRSSANSVRSSFV